MFCPNIEISIYDISKQKLHSLNYKTVLVALSMTYHNSELPFAQKVHSENVFCSTVTFRYSAAFSYILENQRQAALNGKDIPIFLHCGLVDKRTCICI